MSFNTRYASQHKHRFAKTIAFIKKHLPSGSRVLDLGVDNPFADMMRNENFEVFNTSGVDLDENISEVLRADVDAVCAFEIFEHLVNPYQVLKNIRANTLISTVPLRLWFSPAYQNKHDALDRHFHEFEDWQFDWILDKTGWQIVDREKWISPTKITGLRPLLRNFTPRHYAVYAKRKLRL